MPGVAACWLHPRPDTRARVPAVECRPWRSTRPSARQSRGPCQLRPAARPPTGCSTTCVPSQLAARRTAGGARNARTRTRSRTKPSAPPFHGTPTSAPSTMRRCGPAAASSGYVARLRHSATRSAAPSRSALHGCGWPVRVNGETSVVSQHNAIPLGVAP